MYYGIVITLMFAFPLLSIGIETCTHSPVIFSVLVIKWFGFWSVGVRLMLAGLRQIFQPAYTAHVILGLKSDESLILVRELGFANLAIGSVAFAGIFMPTWQLPAATAGGIFYALAGINHIFQPHRNRLENVAMVSDLFVAIVLTAACI